MTKLSKSLLRDMMDEVIISHRNGKPYLKRRPKKVNNPKTEQQTSQRGKFKAASTFVSRNLNELIRPYWNPEAKRQGMTGQNLFCKTNTQAFDADGNADFDKLKLVVGDLEGVKDLKIVKQNKNLFHFTWKSMAKGNKAKEACLLKIFGLDELLHAEEIPCTATRKDESCTCTIPSDNYQHLCLFFWNEELALASEAKLCLINNDELKINN